MKRMIDICTNCAPRSGSEGVPRKIKVVLAHKVSAALAGLFEDTKLSLDPCEIRSTSGAAAAQLTKPNALLALKTATKHYIIGPRVKARDADLLSNYNLATDFVSTSPLRSIDPFRNCIAGVISERPVNTLMTA